MSTSIMDDIFFSNPFPKMGWQWTPNEPLPIQLYHNKLWEIKYYDHFYRNCYYLMIPIYEPIFNAKPPRMSQLFVECQSKIGDWFSKENFTYVIIYGCSGAPLALPLCILDRLLCKWVAYQTIGKGIVVDLRKASKNSWSVFHVQVCICTL